jgi:hypothetical protein
LQQLLARAIVVPGPVVFNDFNELGGGLLAAVLGIEEDGEIESRLMVAGIGRDLSYKLGSIAASRRLGRAPSFCREASARRPRASHLYAVRALTPPPRRQRPRVSSR